MRTAHGGENPARFTEELLEIWHCCDCLLERGEIYMRVVLANGLGIVSHEFLNESGANSRILHEGSSGVTQAVK